MIVCAPKKHVSLCVLCAKYSDKYKPWSVLLSLFTRHGTRMYVVLCIKKPSIIIKRLCSDKTSQDLYA